MILDRYLTTEIIRPFLIGSGMLTVIFTGYSASIQLQHVESGTLSIGNATVLILLNTLISLEVLLPTALFFSVLVTITRLHKDSEMATIRAAGISELRIVEAVFKLSAVIALLVATITLVGRPWAYAETYRIESQTLADFDLLETETGQFINMADSGYVLFAKGVDRTKGELKDVFLQRNGDYGKELIYAASAKLPATEINSAPIAEFSDGYLYLIDAEGQRDVINRYGSMVIHLPLPEKTIEYRRKAQSTLSLMLSTRLKDIAEYQTRLSTPLATIILAMLAVPLGRASSRQTRFGSFFIAVVVYALSMSFIGVVKNALEKGDIASNPGMWLAYLPPALLLFLLLNSHQLQRLKRL